MALALANLNQRIGTSYLHDNILEDVVQNVCSLKDFDVDTRDDGRI